MLMTPALVSPLPFSLKLPIGVFVKLLLYTPPETEEREPFDFAIALSQGDRSPAYLARWEVVLHDPNIPATSQPHHEVMELPWSDAQAVSAAPDMPSSCTGSPCSSIRGSPSKSRTWPDLSRLVSR